ncbi:MAG: dTDP-4-amino-4,6-dideoxygalactose transaminase [Saprospiraceae bacterium]|jgi:dTDP-4-amino-4,6-dideoxygalactose transaminase
MSQHKIYLSSPHMGGQEMDFVNEAYNTNWIAPLGPNVNGLESDISSYNDITHCAALSSGTGAIHLALILLGVDIGDEVLCSSFTFSASANPIVYQKATPVFIDSEADTWNMCPVMLKEAIVERIEKGKRPKACILVHLYGMPSNLEDIVEVCSQYDIPIIEDSAEAIGSTYKGQKAGTFGTLGIYSFNGNKIITTSGGGALVSDNEGYIKEARNLATQARDEAPHYQHSKIGYNYRMSNICAGIGRGQMIVLDERVKQRRAMNQWYRDLLAPYSFISFQTEPNEDYFSNFWLTGITVAENKKGITRETIRLTLLEKNIESRPLWKPMHLQPIFDSYPAYTNGVSEDLFDRGLCLPSGSNLTLDEKERIQSALLRILNGE